MRGPEQPNDGDGARGGAAPLVATACAGGGTVGGTGGAGSTGLGGGDAALGDERDDPGMAFCAADAGRCAGMPVPARAGGADGGAAGRADGGAAGVFDGGAVGCGVGEDPPAGPPGAVGSGAAQAVEEGLADLRRGIAQLRGVALWMLGQKDLVAVAREVESAVRSAFGVQVRLAGEINERGIAGMLDVRSAAHLLHQTLNITMSESRARVLSVADLADVAVIGVADAAVGPRPRREVPGGALVGVVTSWSVW